LNPDTHLTNETWKLFKAYALEKGYNAKRIKATEEQKKEINEKRKSSVYFVEICKKGEKSVTEKRKRETKKDESGEKKERPVRKSKKIHQDLKE
jgi:hypothetical protein